MREREGEGGRKEWIKVEEIVNQAYNVILSTYAPVLILCKYMYMYIHRVPPKLQIIHGV